MTQLEDICKKRIYVTLDTEMDSDEHWVKRYPPMYSSIIEGIPQLLRPMWNRLQVHPIYFVSPEVLYDDTCCKVLREEIRKGATIGAHLHPEYIEPDSIWGVGMEKLSPQFPCYGYSDEVEKEKLYLLTITIEKKLGVKPIWYRAARFGADIATIHTLEELGYQYDSSVTPHIDWSGKGGPNHRFAPKESYVISEMDYYQPTKKEKAGNKVTIEEVPVTIYGKRWGIFGKMLPDNWLFYRWLRPTHMTYLELKSILKQMCCENRRTGVMMFHSMEIMINKTPYVRTKWMQRYYLWRLEKTLQYAKKKGYEL